MRRRNNDSKYKLPRGWKTVRKLQDNPYASWKKVDLPKKDNKIEKAAISHGEEEQKKGMELEQERQLRNEQLQEKELIQEKTISNLRESRNKEIVNKESPIAVRFFERFPRINPFEDNEIILCVKIEPKDIGLLPKSSGD